MNWDDVRIFLAIARAQSLRGAARSLALNHATVGRRLSSLEASLDTRLFERGLDGLSLTQAGEDLLAGAERIEDDIAGVSERVSGLESVPAGLVRLSLPPALMRLFVCRELVAIAERYPSIELDVRLTDEFTDLNRRDADISLRMAHEVHDDVVGRRLLRYSVAVYAAPDYLARRGGGGDEGLAWIGWEADERHPSWTRATPFADAPVRHRLFGHIPQMQAAKAGLGLTMLPCFLGDLEPGLVRAPGCQPAPDRSIWLLLHRSLGRTARVRVLVDHIAEALLGHRALFEGSEGPRLVTGEL